MPSVGSSLSGNRNYPLILEFLLTSQSTKGIKMCFYYGELLTDEGGAVQIKYLSFHQLSQLFWILISFNDDRQPIELSLVLISFVTYSPQNLQ